LTPQTRRIAITGAAGNLGGRLRRHLASRPEWTLVLLDKDPRGDASILQADLADGDAAWSSVLEGVDTIVHLAANADASAPWSALTGPNIDSVLNLYAAAARAGVRRVILASSVWAMAGRTADDLPILAGDADPGTSAYGATKLFAERVAAAHAKSNGPSTIALRIGGCPPGDNPPLRKNAWEDQCWLSAGDFCRAVTAAIEAPHAGFAAVNLTSEIPNSRWSLAEAADLIGYAPADRFAPLEMTATGRPRFLSGFARLAKRLANGGR